MTEAKQQVPKEDTHLLAAGGGSADAQVEEDKKSRLQRLWGRFRIPTIILSEMILSIGLNFYNAYLLKHVPGFVFPVIYTTVHMITSFLGSAILIYCCKAAKVSWPQAWQYAAQIVVLALLRGASITTNNWSLRYINLALNKVIKASAPIFTVLLSIFLEGKRYSAAKIGTLFVLAVGTMLSCTSHGSTRQDVRGIALALISSVVGGSSIVVSALLLGKGTGLGSINLLFYFSPIQAVVLSTLIPFTELDSFKAWASLHHRQAFGYILMGAFLAFAFNMLSFLLVQSTSSVTTAMLGNVKIVLVIVMSAALFGADAEPINVIGYCLTVVAACTYTTVNLHERGQLEMPCLKKKEPDGGAAYTPAPASAPAVTSGIEAPVAAPASSTPSG